jgi:hypothetical protein
MKSINKENFEQYYIDKNGSVYNSKRDFKEIKAHPIPTGYMLLVLHSPKTKPKGFYIHRLVAETYIPNPNNYPEVNHKNKVRNDNRIENLEWCTKKQNVQHKYENYKTKYDIICSNKELLEAGIKLYLRTYDSKKLGKFWHCSFLYALYILKKNNIEIKRYGYAKGPHKKKPAYIFNKYIPKYWFMNNDVCTFSL